jgi:hypothetical protein
MRGWFARKLRERRARTYLQSYPDDETAVQIILVIIDTLSPTSARQVAEMTAGRKFSDTEWSSFGPRWERAWAVVVSPT